MWDNHERRLRACGGHVANASFLIRRIFADINLLSIARICMGDYFLIETRLKNDRYKLNITFYLELDKEKNVIKKVE